MKEGAPHPVSVVKNESVRRHTEIHTVEPTEEVMAKFREEAEAHDEPCHEQAECEKLFHSLHRILDGFENTDIKDQYEEGVVPTLESMERASVLAAEGLEQAGDEEALAHAKLLRGKVKSISMWCNRYVESILRFRATNMARLRLSDSDTREDFANADRERRRIHDTLLSSLTQLQELLVEARELEPKLVPKIAEWNPGMPVPRGFAHTNAFVFGKSAIADRAIIRDWSIIARAVERIHQITSIKGFP